MKKRHVIATFALSTLLGVGIFAGAQNWKTWEAKAGGTKTLYLDANIWDAGAGEKFYGWLFGGTTADQWYTFTSDGDYYKAEVADDYTKVVFLRSGPTMEPGWTKDTNYWNRTDDETFGDNDLFKVTAWGTTYSTGTWSKYVAPTPVSYKMQVNGGEAITMTKDGPQYKALGVHVQVGDEFTFTKDDAAYVATPEEAGNNNYGSHGIRVAAAEATVDVYLKPAENKFWVSGTVAPEESAAYYMLVNDVNPVKMTDNTAQTADEYCLTHVALAEDDEISFLYVGPADEDPSDNYSYYNIETLKEGSLDFYKTDTNKVKAAGTYDIYATMTYGETKLYVAVNTEGWVRYLDINGAKTPMNVNPGNPNEYQATVDLEAGDELGYFFGEDEASATEQTSSAKLICNNNLNASKEVLVDANAATVYVDITNGQIWVGGISEFGYHLIKNSRTLVTLTHGEKFGDYDQWFSASIPFAKDDTILFLDAHAEAEEAANQHLPVVFGVGIINAGGLGEKFEIVDPEANPKVIKAREAVAGAQVYLKLLNEHDEVYFGEEAEYITKAKEFADGFKIAMATACATAESGKQAAVEAAWAEKATAFGLLVKEVKDELKLGNYSSVAEVREFGARYVGIKQQHGTWTLEDFLEWNVQPLNNIQGFEVDSSTATLIVVISVATIISAAGLFLVLKRKKHAK